MSIIVTNDGLVEIVEINPGPVEFVELQQGPPGAALTASDVYDAPQVIESPDNYELILAKRIYDYPPPNYDEVFVDKFYKSTFFYLKENIKSYLEAFSILVRGFFTIDVSSLTAPKTIFIHDTSYVFGAIKLTLSTLADKIDTVIGDIEIHCRNRGLEQIFEVQESPDYTGRAYSFQKEIGINVQLICVGKMGGFHVSCAPSPVISGTVFDATGSGTFLIKYLTRTSCFTTNVINSVSGIAFSNLVVYFTSVLFKCRFSITDSVVAGNSFIGISTSVGAGNSNNPSTFINCYGFGTNANSPNLQFFYGGSTPQIPINLGPDFPYQSSFLVAQYLYDVQIVRKYDGITYWIKSVTTGAMATGTVTRTAGANGPSQTTRCSPRAERSNGAIASSVGIEIAYIILEE